jgi:HD-GYP domain-containing protein (c-di-GMP phosphodiesterase class II)/DNA-binding CsgD family transcriptional regulator
VTEPAPARLAELLGSLSLATDLAAGLPPETALRTAVVAARLGAAAGITGAAHAQLYYTGLLRFLGCTAFAHEMAGRYAAGDDLGLLRELTAADSTRPLTVLRGAWRGINHGAGWGARARAFARLAREPGAAAALGSSHCELAVALARRLNVGDAVVAALGEVYERWDGGGAPAGLRGDAIGLPARVVHVAWRLCAHLALGGADAAIAELQRRRGKDLDPSLATLAVRNRNDLLQGLTGAAVFTTFLDAEPAPRVQLLPDRLRDIAAAFGAFADVKSPFTSGHSQRVARFAGAAARSIGLAPGATALLETAALLHDVGRVAIANGIWDKPAALSRIERDHVQSHSFETDRILRRSALLAPVAALASQAHERLDGAGYHRGLAGTAITTPARLLAAADIFAALGEARPHRSAFARPQIASLMGQEAQAGRLSADAVNAVLAGAGMARGRRALVPAALSDREVEVVRLIVRGRANKEIATALGIAPATVKRHLENLFAKIGARTRAAIAVWAVENHVLDLDDA